MVLIGGLAAFAVVLSDMPGWLGWPLAFAAQLRAVHVARRQLRRAPVALLIAPGDGVSTIDGVPVRDLAVTWRGPLAFVRWRDEEGHRRRLALWPDVLAPAARRELRLAAPTVTEAPPAASVAP